MTSLGRLYENGLGVPRDYDKAREWWEKAAALDNATAMNYLAWLYQSGPGVLRDFGKAREWYEKAAAKEAREQLEKAAAKGDTDAKARLKELGPR